MYVKDGRISCPQKGCDAAYPVAPEAEPQMGTCPQCGSEFLIVTPERELRLQPKSAERSEQLLPQVKNLLTSTVMLDRNGTEMLPESASAIGGELPTVPIDDNQVACPQCGQKYPVTPDLSGKYATCSECSARFRIG